METLINDIVVILIMLVVVGFTYVGCHMSVEKDLKKRIPMIWEKGGLLNKTYHKVFDKSKVKYFDGDNT